jgi:hypothetical protein
MVDRIGGGCPIDQASFNRVGPGWAPDTRVERADYDLHLAFDKPPPQAPVRPAPPLPTESEVRDQLAAALKLKSASETALGRAQAAHDRAEHHVANCRQKCADYVDLDDAIAGAMVDALRCDAGRVSADMTEEHEVALSDRAMAQAELAAAESALTTFRAEYAQASKAQGDAVAAVEALIIRVLAYEAERLALHHEQALAMAVSLRPVLVGFDYFATPRRGVVTGPLLAKVWSGIDRSMFARQVAQPIWTLWRNAADQLRADPHATITLALPEVAPVVSPLLAQRETEEAA